MEAQKNYRAALSLDPPSYETRHPKPPSFKPNGKMETDGGGILLEELKKERKIIDHFTVHNFTHLAAARAERLEITPKRRRWSSRRFLKSWRHLNWPKSILLFPGWSVTSASKHWGSLHIRE
jgi:hypothetical protein